MGFGQAVATGFSKYFNFTDRAPRSEFWYWVLFVNIVTAAVFAIDLALHNHLPLSLVNLALWFPNVAIAVRRFHDLDRRGWWILLSFIPIIGWIAIWIWFAQEGTDGPNRFGPDPLGNQSSGQTCPEPQPLARAVKADDGYFKKCPACGKFTRNAKVCRHCGHALTDRAIDASRLKAQDQPPTTSGAPAD